MTEWCLFTSLNTCSAAPDMPFTPLSPSSSVFFGLSNITILLRLQFKAIKCDTRSCGVCYFTFVAIHLHTASLQELEQCPLSIHHLHDMAYIQRTGGGGGTSMSSPSPPTSLHQMLLAKSLPVVFDLVLTPQVLYSLEGLVDDLSLDETITYQKISELSCI